MCIHTSKIRSIHVNTIADFFSRKTIHHVERENALGVSRKYAKRLLTIISDENKQFSRIIFTHRVETKPGKSYDDFVHVSNHVKRDAVFWLI